MNRSLMLFAIALLATLSWESRGNSALPEENASEPLTEVRVQLKWTHQFQFAGLYAAIEQGYYTAAGMRVTLIEFQPELNPIDQLLGGRVAFAVADTGAMIYHANGVPLVALAAIFQHSPSILISRADGNIQTLQDLKDQRAMLAGGFLNAELMAMLQQAGIQSDSFQLMASNTSITALINGDTDAYNGYSTNEPFFLERQNIPFITFQPRDYGVDFYGDILLTTETLIERDPELVRAFRAATLRGWQYAVQHPEDVVNLILEHYNSQQKSREHLLFEAHEAIKLILPNVVPIGYMNADRWAHIAEVFRQQGFIHGPVDLNRFVYRGHQPPSLQEWLWQHRLPVGLSLAASIALLLTMQVMYLQHLVRLRTHQLEQAKTQAEAEARTDVLTNLPNRRYFMEVLERNIAQSRRHHGQLSIILLDIDHFKAINDRFGHPAGDEALRRVANTLCEHIRTGDIAARVGGEEFAIACPLSTLEEARILAERLRIAIASLGISCGNNTLSLTVSLGCATLQDHLGQADLIARADQALYAAKQAGRNQTYC